MNAIAVALILIALAVASIPIAATIIVSIASRREDSRWTLSGPAPGPTSAIARRLLDFHTDGGWPARRKPARRPAAEREGGTACQQRRTPPPPDLVPPSAPKHADLLIPRGETTIKQDQRQPSSAPP
jgi:hypothetical protein